MFIDPKAYVTFLCPNKKVTKEIGIGEALRANAPSPMYPTRRTDHRPLKMFRFSAGSAEQTFGFVVCKRSKIGTFLNAGWRCGGVILKRGAFTRSALLSRLLWGTFLAETRKVQLIGKLQFESRIQKKCAAFSSAPTYYLFSISSRCFFSTRLIY